MNSELEQISIIFRDVLEDDSIVLHNETTASEIEGWDSLNHIYLIVEIEKHFKIKFTSTQIAEWKNVGDIVKSIKS